MSFYIYLYQTYWTYQTYCLSHISAGCRKSSDHKKSCIEEVRNWCDTYIIVTYNRITTVMFFLSLASGKGEGEKANDSAIVTIVTRSPCA